MDQHQFYIVEFLEHPHEKIAKYVCVRKSWIFVTDESTQTAAVKYPVEDLLITNKRVENNESFSNDWLIYEINIKHSTDTYLDAQKYINELIKNMIRQRNMSNAAQDGECSSTTQNCTSNGRLDKNNKSRMDKTNSPGLLKKRRHSDLPEQSNKRPKLVPNNFSSALKPKQSSKQTQKHRNISNSKSTAMNQVAMRTAQKEKQSSGPSKKQSFVSRNIQEKATTTISKTPRSSKLTSVKVPTFDAEFFDLLKGIKDCLKENEVIMKYMHITFGKSCSNVQKLMNICNEYENFVNENDMEINTNKTQTEVSNEEYPQDPEQEIYNEEDDEAKGGEDEELKEKYNNEKHSENEEDEIEDGDAEVEEDNEDVSGEEEGEVNGDVNDEEEFDSSEEIEGKENQDDEVEFDSSEEVEGEENQDDEVEFDSSEEVGGQENQDDEEGEDSSVEVVGEENQDDEEGEDSSEEVVGEENQDDEEGEDSSEEVEGDENEDDEDVDEPRESDINHRRVRGEPHDFTLPPEYDENDPRWTLIHREKADGCTELMPHSSIYVNRNRLMNCNRSCSDAKTLARMLLPEIFTDIAMATCSVTGKRANAFKGHKLRPGLDQNAITVLLNYVEQFAEHREWDFDARSVMNTLRNKLQDIRARYRNQQHNK